MPGDARGHLGSTGRAAGRARARRTGENRPTALGELDDIPTSRYDPAMSEAEDPPGLDLDRLRRHLDRECPGLVGGGLRAELVEGGRSNLTYRGHRRHRHLGGAPAAARPCAGHRARHGARAPGDQRAGRHAGPGAGHACCCARTRRSIGAPFYVMDFMPGTPYRSEQQLRAIGPERTRDGRAHPGRHPGGPARGRPAGGRARRLRAARGLPRPAAAPLGQAARRLPQPRTAGHGRAARRAGPGPAALPRARGRARRLPARQRADRRRTAGSPPYWTGRCPPSATRSPTSACW